MTHAPTQAYGDAAFRDPLDIEDEDGAQPAFPARADRPRVLSPARTGSSMRMIVALALGAYGVLWVAVQVGSAIVQVIGGAL